MNLNIKNEKATKLRKHKHVIQIHEQQFTKSRRIQLGQSDKHYRNEKPRFNSNKKLTTEALVSLSLNLFR